MSFYMQNPSTRTEMFGGIRIPIEPFRAATPSPNGLGQAVVGDVAEQVAARTGTVRGMAGRLRAEAIGRVIMAAQEEIVPEDRVFSASRLAGIHWGLQRTTEASRADRLAAQIGLMEVARRTGLEAEFSEMVRLSGARAALEEAQNPRDRETIEAAARGEPGARDRLMDRQPALLGAVLEASENGVGNGFWDRLRAVAEIRLARVEAAVAKGRSDRLQEAARDPQVRRDLEELVARASGDGETATVMSRLARRNADLARVVGKTLAGTRAEASVRAKTLLDDVSGPIALEVRRLRTLSGTLVRGDSSVEMA